MRHVLAALLLVLPACFVVQGNGHIVEEAREVSSFDALSVGSACKADVVIGEPAVTITADDNLLEYVIVRTEGGRLVAEVEDGVHLDPSEDIRLSISAPAVVAIDASGAAEIIAPASRTDRLVVEASGASRVVLSSVDSREVDVDASGASVVTLSGAASRLNLELSGASRGELESLPVATASVDMSGASEATVSAETEIDGELSGASTLFVLGGPSCRVSASGSSELVHR